MKKLILGTLLLLAVAAPVAAQDVLIPINRIPVCPTTRAYLYYQSTVDTTHSVPGWYCSAVSVRNMKMSSLTDATSTTSGTVQSTEYVLNTVTIPATAFTATVGKGIKCEGWGTGAANGNNKNFKVYLGSTAVATVTASTDNAKDFFWTLTVLRSGSNTQTAYATITSDIGAPDAFAVTTVANQTDTLNIVVSFKSANTAAAATSATGKGASCYVLN